MGLQKFLLGFVEVTARQRSLLGELSVSFVCLPQDFLCVLSGQTLLSFDLELDQLFVLLLRVHN